MPSCCEWESKKKGEGEVIPNQELKFYQKLQKYLQKGRSTMCKKRGVRKGGEEGIVKLCILDCLDIFTFISRKISQKGGGGGRGGGKGGGGGEGRGGGKLAV